MVENLHGSIFSNSTFKSNNQRNFQFDAFTSANDAWGDGSTINNTTEHIYKNSFYIFVWNCQIKVSLFERYFIRRKYYLR